MTDLEQAQKAYNEATEEWNRLSDKYEEVELQLATAEYEKDSEVDISELQKLARERKSLADEALNRQIRALNTLVAIDQ